MFSVRNVNILREFGVKFLFRDSPQDAFIYIKISHSRCCKCFSFSLFALSEEEGSLSAAAAAASSVVSLQSVFNKLRHGP